LISKETNHVARLPAYVGRFLSHFEGLRASGDGWDAKCPCPEHNSGSDHPGDQHASLHIAMGHDGRLLVTCRVGCRTDRILDAKGLRWQDLFPRECDASAGIPMSEPKAVITDVGTAALDAAYSTVLAGLSLLGDRPNHGD
jgi:hypothetical protein